MNELELYKQMYYYELDVKEKINARFSIPFSVYVFLIGGMGYVLGQIKIFPNETKSGILIMLLVLYGISLMVTGFFIYKAYYNHTYSYIEDSFLLKKYRKDLCEYYDENYEKFYACQSRTKEELIDSDFCENLINKFAETATTNQNVNNYKYGMFLKVGRYLVLNSILFVLVFIVTFVFIK